MPFTLRTLPLRGFALGGGTAPPLAGFVYRRLLARARYGQYAVRMKTTLYVAVVSFISAAVAGAGGQDNPALKKAFIDVPGAAEINGAIELPYDGTYSLGFTPTAAGLCPYLENTGVETAAQQLLNDITGVSPNSAQFK